MKTSVSIYDFRDRFLSNDTYKNNFSYEGLNALFDYLEQLEEDMGEEMEFDMVAICCDYTEYGNFEELQSNYLDVESMEDLGDKTEVILIPDSERFIIRNF